MDLEFMPITQVIATVMADPWVYMEGMRWVWVRNLFSQSKMVNIVIILNIIDTHTTAQDNPYPSLRVWVCMGVGMGRGENTHGLPMSHTSLYRSN